MNLKRLPGKSFIGGLTLLALSACDGHSGGSSPGVVSTPTGVHRVAYVAYVNEGTLSLYAEDSAAGRLHDKSETEAGGPLTVSVDPTGKFAYVANAAADEISAYRINPDNGALTPVGVPVYAPHPRSVAVDRSGKFVYAEHKNPNTVSVYRIDASTGTLTSLGTVRNRARAFPSTLTKGGSAAADTPKHAYAGNLNPTQVSAYRMDVSTTDMGTAGTDAGSITMTRKIERH